MTDISSVILRDFDAAQDKPLIYTSWRNELWFSESRDKSTAAGFYRHATQEIKHLLAQPQVRVLVAVLAEDSNCILGYSVMDGSHLYWVSVKPPFQRMGIAKLLTRGVQSVSNPITHAAKLILANKNIEVKK